MRLRRVSYRFNFRIDPNIPSHDPEINAERSLLCTFIRFTKIIDHISPFVKRFYKKPYQKFLSGHNLIVEASFIECHWFSRFDLSDGRLWHIPNAKKDVTYCKKVVFYGFGNDHRRRSRSKFVFGSFRPVDGVEEKDKLELFYQKKVSGKKFSPKLFYS